MASQPVAISVARDVEGGSAEKDGAKVAAKAESDASAAFHFHLVSKSPLKTLQSKENAAAWVKWGLEGNTRAVKLRYEENFEDGKQTGAFLRDLVNSRAFHDAVTLKNAHKVCAHALARPSPLRPSLRPRFAELEPAWSRDCS
jgi:hypothetical protein